MKLALQSWPVNESGDQALFALGYRLKDGATGQTFAVWDAYEENEDLDPGEVELVPPAAVNWREQITRLALPTFYHSILWAAGEALDNTIFTDNWGAPPGHKRSGYSFLDKLADHLVLARKLSGEDLDRFVYAARRLYILAGEALDDDAESDEVVATDDSLPYGDIDAQIEQLVHEPDLPYWLRMPRGKHKRKQR